MQWELVLAEIRQMRRLLEAKLGEQAPLPSAFSMRCAAERLSISVETLRRRVADGTVLTVRVGHRVLVPRSELDRLTTCPVKGSTRAAAGRGPPRRRAPRRARNQVDQAAAIRAKVKGL